MRRPNDIAVIVIRDEQQNYRAVSRRGADVSPAGVHDMTPIDFRASVVVEASDEKVLTVLFSEGKQPSTVAVLRCSREAAFALAQNVLFALSQRQN